ncbi:MAG: hypothetical protein GY803_11545, partial [Chloroflexi bacterium]|nr:hypothetical protein [Chloroflexota bacterium]
MNKRTAIIVALLIFIPTVLLFLVSWLLQPLLPAPWNNILILLGIVVAGVLAAISGVNDTVQLVDRLDGEKEDASEASSVKHVEGTDNSGAISAGGHVVGRDQVTFIGTDEAAAIWSRQYLGKSPPPDLEAATKRYLAYVAGRYEFLDFRGMGVHDRAPLRLP